ncbi:hypothetical protein ADIS_0579 [Lunatimonas lonarensis]|uniref:Uncharacterized protein n=1 Tax=Lunatimonas lonarensis TaxID=1232681 RepID=R7ZXV8_9BACT|nr:hypothetical protein ADIS_0579 [Lunatimonas lonarensis]
MNGWILSLFLDAWKTGSIKRTALLGEPPFFDKNTKLTHVLFFKKIAKGSWVLTS